MALLHDHSSPRGYTNGVFSFTTARTWGSAAGSGGEKDPWLTVQKKKTFLGHCGMDVLGASVVWKSQISESVIPLSGWGTTRRFSQMYRPVYLVGSVVVVCVDSEHGHGQVVSSLEKQYSMGDFW